MSNKWKEISIEEARRHPLYGVDGWLIVFAILIALEFIFRVLYYLGGVRGSAGSAYLGIFGILFLSILVIYWLLFTKHHFFRHIVSVLYVIYLLLLDYNFYYWIVPYAIWIIYLQQSKRVRVTYEQCVIQDSAPNDQNLQIQTPVASTQVKQSVLNTQLNNHASAVTSANIVKGAKQVPTIPATTQATLTSSDNTDSSPSEEFWAAAYEEFESPARRPGLWAKTFAEANGNEAVAKAAYLSLRAGEMQSAESKRVQDLRAAEIEMLKQAREKELKNTEEQRLKDLEAAKGTCPNCKKIILLSANSCKYCTALFEFDVNGTWRPIPLK